MPSFGAGLATWPTRKYDQLADKKWTPGRQTRAQPARILGSSSQTRAVTLSERARYTMRHRDTGAGFLPDGARSPLHYLNTDKEAMMRIYPGE